MATGFITMSLVNQALQQIAPQEHDVQVKNPMGRYARQKKTDASLLLKIFILTLILGLIVIIGLQTKSVLMSFFQDPTSAVPDIHDTNTTDTQARPNDFTAQYLGVEKSNTGSALTFKTNDNSNESFSGSLFLVEVLPHKPKDMISEIKSEYQEPEQVESSAVIDSMSLDVERTHTQESLPAKNAPNTIITHSKDENISINNDLQSHQAKAEDSSVATSDVEQNANYWLTSAQIEVSQKNIPEAISILKSAPNSINGYERITLYLSRLLITVNDFESAISALAQVNSLESLELTALAFESNNQFIEAANVYQNLINSYSLKPVWFLRTAVCYENIGNYDQAIAYHTQFIANSPDHRLKQFSQQRIAELKAERV